MAHGVWRMVWLRVCQSKENQLASVEAVTGAVLEIRELVSRSQRDGCKCWCVRPNNTGAMVNCCGIACGQKCEFLRCAGLCKLMMATEIVFKAVCNNFGL